MGMERSLSDMMKREAIAHGLCDQWTSEWADDTDKDALVEKFVKGIDFCIKNDWPSVEQIKMFLPEANMHGVYADQAFSVRNPSVVIANGSCDGTVLVDDGISTVWVRHTSKIFVRVRRGGVCFLRLLDDCDVKVDCGFFSKCKAFVYSDGVKIEASDIVDINKKIGFYNG